MRNGKPPQFFLLSRPRRAVPPDPDLPPHQRHQQKEHRPCQRRKVRRPCRPIHHRVMQQRTHRNVHTQPKRRDIHEQQPNRGAGKYPPDTRTPFARRRSGYSPPRWTARTESTASLPPETAQAGIGTVPATEIISSTALPSVHGMPSCVTESHINTIPSTAVLSRRGSVLLHSTCRSRIPWTQENLVELTALHDPRKRC